VTEPGLDWAVLPRKASSNVFSSCAKIDRRARAPRPLPAMPTSLQKYPKMTKQAITEAGTSAATILERAMTEPVIARALVPVFQEFS